MHLRERGHENVAIPPWFPQIIASNSLRLCHSTEDFFYPCSLVLALATAHRGFIFLKKNNQIMSTPMPTTCTDSVKPRVGLTAPWVFLLLLVWISAGCAPTPAAQPATVDAVRAHALAWLHSQELDTGGFPDSQGQGLVRMRRTAGGKAAAVLPVSTSVRRSFTIWYGCRT